MWHFKSKPSYLRTWALCRRLALRSSAPAPQMSPQLAWPRLGWISRDLAGCRLPSHHNLLGPYVPVAGVLLPVTFVHCNLPSNLETRVYSIRDEHTQQRKCGYFKVEREKMVIWAYFELYNRGIFAGLVKELFWLIFAPNIKVSTDIIIFSKGMRICRYLDKLKKYLCSARANIMQITHCA